jgi:hypothetical protein
MMKRSIAEQIQVTHNREHADQHVEQLFKRYAPTLRFRQVDR